MNFYAAFPLIERRRTNFSYGGEGEERKPLIDRAEKSDRQQACTMWATGREMERGGSGGGERGERGGDGERGRERGGERERERERERKRQI